MSKRVPFTQADVERAIRVLRKMGQTVTGFETTEEGFRILTAEGPPPKAQSPYEQWKTKNGGRAA